MCVWDGLGGETDGDEDETSLHNRRRAARTYCGDVDLIELAAQHDQGEIDVDVAIRDVCLCARSSMTRYQCASGCVCVVSEVSSDSSSLSARSRAREPRCIKTIQGLNEIVSTFRTQAHLRLYECSPLHRR